MTCNNCLQEILQGESFFEDEDNGTAYHADCRQAAIDRRNKAEAENRRLAARVAELEAQLAAQQWRPIDEPAPKGEIEVKMRCAVTDDGQVYKIPTGTFVGWWIGANDSEWRPLPTAPQEPTP